MKILLALLIAFFFYWFAPLWVFIVVAALILLSHLWGFIVAAAFILLSHFSNFGTPKIPK